MQRDPLKEGSTYLADLSSRFDAAARTSTTNALLEILRVCSEARGLESLVGAPVVAALRAADVSWLEVADALGITRQAAWERYRNAEGLLDPSSLPAGLLAAAAKAESAPELEVGQIYTRVQLQRMFGIKDATLKNGVFPMRERREIWLFVTRDKQADRTQFEDRLEGDTLYWEGQTSGRTDALIRNHVIDGTNILVFYRESKTEHPGAGFRLEGEFRYVTSDDQRRPTKFVLERGL